MSKSERKKKKKTKRDHLSKYQRKVLDRQHSGESESAAAFDRKRRKDFERQIKYRMVPKEHLVMDPY